MGLAGPKKNTKISADPRNTHWASNTDRFGHRILEQYGWKPGSTLGDTTSAHHAHLTSASHTGIKVMVKDDVLGIGAKKKSEDHECTGLDVFQDLLGRLNGKDEGEVERGREAREKNRREIIVGERYRMRFVLGEVYQSSDIEQLLRKQKEGGEVKAEVKGEMKVKMEVEVEEDGVALKLERLKVKEVEVEVEVEGERKKEKSRKRKIKEEGLDEEEEKRRRKKEKKDKKEKKEKKDKKGKEDRKEKGKGRESKSSGATTPSDESEESLPPMPKESTKDKEAKDSSNDRKEKKKEKKEKKEKRDKKNKKMQKVSKESSPDSSNEEEPDTPDVAAVAATTRALTGRRAIRHKYIAAKRSAVMDVQALNEIFMIKA